MVLEADRLGCVREVMVIAAALSIQDPRERPPEHQQAADAAHARFADPTSDFLGWLNLWTYVHDQARELSSSAFRRLCKREFLNYLRIREWQDLVAQLRQLARSVDVTLNASPCEDPVRIHTALLAGLLSHIGVKDVLDKKAEKKDRRERGEYLGARGAKFAIFPGSALHAKQPAWVMAAELVETSRLCARQCAKIEPEWVEPLAQHLVKRTYSEPHWEARRGSVVAVEQVTLYGVPDRRRPHRAVRPDRPRAVPRAVHPARARRGRLAHPPPRSSRRTGSCSTTSRTSRTAPAAATSSSTTRPSSASTTRGSPRTSSPARTSTAGGSRPGTPTPTC